MAKKNLGLCGMFLAIMFVLLMVGTAVVSVGTATFGFVTGLGLACMGAAMYFWYKFASPKYGSKIF